MSLDPNSIQLSKVEKVYAESLKNILLSPGDSYIVSPTLSAIELPLVSPQKAKIIQAQVWENAVRELLDGGLLSSADEEKLSAYAQRYSLDAALLNRKGGFDLYHKSKLLNSVLAGKLPDCEPSVNIGLNLKRNERIVSVFDDVIYLKEKLQTSYKGGSHGASIRVAKGIIYRVGSFKGQPVQSVVRNKIDIGKLVVTNKGICFVGGCRSVRIAYDNILSFHPYKDGIGITKDKDGALLDIFVLSDIWFSYNLIYNLSLLNSNG